MAKKKKLTPPVAKKKKARPPKIQGLLLSDARANGHLLIIDTPEMEITIDLFWSGYYPSYKLWEAVIEANKAADEMTSKIGGRIDPEHGMAALNKRPKRNVPTKGSR